MWFAQKYRGQITMGKLGFAKSVAIGIFQSGALFPGISRSGSTISGSLIVGMSRLEAARFSFLLSMPIVFAAGTYKIVSTEWSNSAVSFPILAVGFLASFITGFLVIGFLMKFLKTNNLTLFIVYRLLLVLFLLLFK
jgi:undecaprenyl-diphosphatase